MYLQTKQEIPLKNSSQYYVGHFVFQDDSLCLITSLSDTVVEHYHNYKLSHSYKYNTSTYLQRCCSLESHEVILLHPQNKKIEHINIQTGSKLSIDFEYSRIQSPFDCELRAFPQSKCFCVIEKYEQNQTKNALFTFFNKALEQVYQYNCDAFDPSYKILNVDLNSKLAIVKGRQSGILKMGILDFQQQTCLPFQTVIPHTIGESIVVKRVNVLQQGKFLIFCQCNDIDVKLLQWDHQQNQLSKFEFKNIKSSQIFEIYYGRDYYYLLMFSPQPPSNKSLYIVDASSLEIVESFEGKVDHEHQYQVQLVNGHSRIIELRVEKYGRPKYAGLKVITVVNQKQIYINLLEEIGGFNEEMIRHITNSFKLN